MENIVNYNCAMRQNGSFDFEKNQNYDWTDNAANAVSKAFSSVADFSTLFEENEQ